MYICSSHEDLTQALIMTKELCPISKGIALKERRVTTLHSLLCAQHCGTDVIFPKSRGIHADEENITALWLQLFHFTADRICQTFTNGE